MLAVAASSGLRQTPKAQQDTLPMRSEPLEGSCPAGHARGVSLDGEGQGQRETRGVPSLSPEPHLQSTILSLFT